MLVRWVETENFRLLETGRVELSEGVNVITGANAQGKTTLLEAVYLLTGMKSFRTFYDRELVAFGEEEARISGLVEAAGREQKLELRLGRGRSRQFRRNGARLSPEEMRENLKAILFSPDDLGMVRGPAASRRKDWRDKPSVLDALDDFSENLCRCSARIIRYRASFSARLCEKAAPVQREFSGGLEELGIAYATVSTVEDPLAPEREIYEAVAERQRQLRQAELDAGQCLVGAHKDDLVFTINGADARSYASQGQARTAALSVKLAERDIFLAETGEVPVLLLDDVLSELDAGRQEFVLNRIGGGQTLVTSCEAESVSRLLKGRVLTVEKGRVRA